MVSCSCHLVYRLYCNAFEDTKFVLVHHSPHGIQQKVLKPQVNCIDNTYGSFLDSCWLLFNYAFSYWLAQDLELLKDFCFRYLEA